MEWLRGRVREFIQQALEEVTEFLGRARYQRRAAVDAPQGYRNGYGKPRQLTTPVGTICLRWPRVRDVEERFRSRLLPLFARRMRGVSDLLPEWHSLRPPTDTPALRGRLGRPPVSQPAAARPRPIAVSRDCGRWGLSTQRCASS